jgi:transcriptional regulator with XRE-family HTH domain
VQFKTEKCRRCKTVLVFQVMKDEQPVLPNVEEWVDDRKNWAERIGANLKRLRKQKGMEQKRLAELMGTPRQYLSKVEHFRLEPTLDTLYRIADGLGVNVIELFSSERELMSEQLLSDPFLAEAARLTEAQQVAVLGFAKQLAGGGR